MKVFSENSQLLMEQYLIGLNLFWSCSLIIRVTNSFENHTHILVCILWYFYKTRLFNPGLNREKQTLLVPYKTPASKP